MRGLDPEKPYLCESTGKIYSGAALMYAGYPVPVVMGEYKTWQVHLTIEKESA